MNGAGQLEILMRRSRGLREQPGHYALGCWAGVQALFSTGWSQTVAPRLLRRPVGDALRRIG
jgi:hypothetical protein